MRFFKSRKVTVTPTPEAPRTIEDALADQLKLLREQYLIVRDPDGTWTAYHKDVERGSWFVWRRLRYVPELRAEKPVKPVRDVYEPPPPLDPKWEAPWTFPEEWTE